MPHTMEIKGGELLIPFSIRDVMEAVEEYMGVEVRQYLEEYLSDNITDTDELEREIEECEKRSEGHEEHYREVLTNIKMELDALDTLLLLPRMNRARMQGAVKIAHQMVRRALHEH